jgi:hypothetical protein
MNFYRKQYEEIQQMEELKKVNKIRGNAELALNILNGSD